MEKHGKEKTTAISDGDGIVVKMNESNRYYQVNENGTVDGPIEIVFDSNPGELEGAGTETAPFVIMSIEDLMFFSEQVSKGIKIYSDGYIELGKTLDFNSDLSYADINTKNYNTYLGGNGTKGLKEELTEGLGFKPINNFYGTFDGENNWIKNIYINMPTANGVGVFGITNSIIIQNLNISGNIIGNQSVGSLIGGAHNANCNIQINNCNNYAIIKGLSYVGGIAGDGMGKGVKPVNCSNYGLIIATQENVGGIVGVNGRISGCVNYGKISGPKHVGGICGNSNSGEIFECINNGEVTGEQVVGGIYGHSGNDGVAERCYNAGKVAGTVNVGGIAGVVYRGGYIKCVYNAGEISGTENVGGIIGDSYDDWGRSIISENCYNIGNVTGTTNVGQSIGKLSTSSSKYFTKIYYLNTSSSKGIGNISDIEGIVEGKTAAELKNKNFLDLLNATHTHNVNGTDVDYTSNCWVADTQNINSGYPIFSYQVPNIVE